jgi:hypothetical protein
MTTDADIKTVADAIETEMTFPCSFCRAGEREYPHHNPCDGVNALAALASLEATIIRQRAALREYTKLANAKNPDIARHALAMEDR